MLFKDIYYLHLLYQWFRRRCRLKIFIIYSCCTSGSGGDVVKRYLLSTALVPVVQEKMSSKDISYLQLLYQWFRRRCRLKLFIIYSSCTSGSGEDVVLRYLLSTALVLVVQEKMSLKDIYYPQLLYSGSGGDDV